MAAASNRRDLYLQVSGNIDGLSAAMKAGRSVLNEFGTVADNTADEVRKAFASLGGDSVEQSARQIERAYSATFDKIRRNAKQVASAPSGPAAFQIVDAAAADEAAGAAERQAAGLRLVADAAARAAAATKDDAGAARVYATAAEAAAIGAEREAVAMRGQSNVIAGVRNELGALGGAQTKAVAISGQAKAGYPHRAQPLGGSPRLARPVRLLIDGKGNWIRCAGDRRGGPHRDRRRCGRPWRPRGHADRRRHLDQHAVHGVGWP